jgi:hypothetical protein
LRPALQGHEFANVGASRDWHGASRIVARFRDVSRFVGQ